MNTKINDEVVGVFQDLRMLDNFYQTSSFFPMPVVAITTLNDDLSQNLAPYSLIFPYYVVGQDYYAMLLNTRNNSNTARNLLRTKKCALNFLSDDKKYMKECVRMGFPGDESHEKMKDCIFTFQDGLRTRQHPKQSFPKIITEAYQVFECTWMSNLENADRFSIQESYTPPYNQFNGITSSGGAHFILRVDNILIKPTFRQPIIDGVKRNDFPKIPIGYGFRDNNNFWLSKFKHPYIETIPKGKGSNVNFVKFNADRIDPNVKFTEEACEALVKVPKIFLKKALNGCVEWAREHDVSLLTSEHMAKIRNKRK